MSKSEYKSASGHTVTLYKADGGTVTVVRGEITCYTPGGEMYGAPSLEAALRNIGWVAS